MSCVYSVIVQACYVDRVEFRTRLVSRRFPTVRGWTAALLRKRQRKELKANAFGKGGVEDRADPKKLEAQYKDQSLTAANRVDDSVVLSVDDVIKNTMETIKSMKRMVHSIQTVSATVKADGRFQAAAHAAFGVIGVQDPPENVPEDPVGSMTQAMADEDTRNPGWLGAVEIMVEAGR